MAHSNLTEMRVDLCLEDLRWLCDLTEAQLSSWI